MIHITNIKLEAGHSEEALVKAIETKLKISKKQKYSYHIIKKSIDARKEKVWILYSIGVECENEGKIVKNVRTKDVSCREVQGYDYIPQGEKKMKFRPIVVGSGPAGLFCGYMLANYGYRPIVIERGSCMKKRTKVVEEFWKGEKLNEECNVSFGEGGAGTFSDGKLNTGVKDKFFREKKVLDTFVEHGANENILYDAKPHIGTDILSKVVVSMRNRIIELGGEFKFDTCVKDIIVENNEIKGVITDKDESLYSNIVVLAIGHSSRDTFKMLVDKEISMIPKAFAVGVRVEHSQEFIQKKMYGSYADKLPAASYKVTYQSEADRGVYSFCMCPGGYVVNASSQENMLAINGMSYSGRDGKNANSAIVVTVTPDDFDGEDVLAGVRFQQNLERAAYKTGNGKIPVQLFRDFIDNKKSVNFEGVKPQFKGSYELANLNECLPEYICKSIIEGMYGFDKKIKGFASDDTLLSAVESRTSSPVRIVREDDTLQSVSCKGLYPCGEGAGYAGGIMSAAMDGIKVFEKIADIYSSDIEELL